MESLTITDQAIVYNLIGTKSMSKEYIRSNALNITVVPETVKSTRNRINGIQNWNII